MAGDGQRAQGGGRLGSAAARCRRARAASARRLAWQHGVARLSCAKMAGSAWLGQLLGDRHGAHGGAGGERRGARRGTPESEVTVPDAATGAERHVTGLGPVAAPQGRKTLSPRMNRAELSPGFPRQTLPFERWCRR
jgi:hypothetical protein